MVFYSLSLHRALLWALLSVFLFSVFASAGSAASEEGNGVFPSFGEGPVEVRIYASYFCSPCRALEPELEPILEELVETGRIRLTFVDVPDGNFKPYIHGFLFALNDDKSMENAARVRRILFDVAKNRGGKQEIQETFEREGIRHTPFDPEAVFLRFNQLIREDAVRVTPSAAIHKKGEGKTITGGRDILSALRALKSEENGN